MQETLKNPYLDDITLTEENTYMRAHARDRRGCCTALRLLFWNRFLRTRTNRESRMRNVDKFIRIFRNSFTTHAIPCYSFSINIYAHIYIYIEYRKKQWGYDDVDAIFIEYIILSREKNYIIVTYTIFVHTPSNKH